MVLEWLWGSSSPKDSSSAVKNLDPQLRDILKEQESQSQSQSSPSASPPTDSSNPQQQHSYVVDLQKSGQLHDYKPSDPTSKPQVPPQSRYQDGRYAHLWKNYEPQLLVESRGETEADRLRNLSADLERRKTRLGSAALENCVVEQLAELQCLKDGNAYSKLTMCRAEKKKFTRCYDMQLKFHKALGYFEAIGDEERQDRIQMHADALWQRLSAQGDEIEKAREEGREVPVFEGILSPQTVSSVGASLPRGYANRNASGDGEYAYPNIPEPARAEFDKKIEGMEPKEAKIEEAVFLGEMESRRRTAVESFKSLQEEALARQKRFEEGRPTWNDRVKRWSGWDQEDSSVPPPPRPAEALSDK